MGEWSGQFRKHSISWSGYASKQDTEGLEVY